MYRSSPFRSTLKNTEKRALDEKKAEQQIAIGGGHTKARATKHPEGTQPGGGGVLPLQNSPTLRKIGSPPRSHILDLHQRHGHPVVVYRPQQLQAWENGKVPLGLYSPLRINPIYLYFGGIPGPLINSGK